VKGSRVLVLGVAYKKDINDVRESPALDIIELLRQKGADVRYHDPYVLEFSYNGFRFESVSDLEREVREADCVIVVTDHSVYPWLDIRRWAKCLVSTRHLPLSEQIVGV